MKPPEAPWSPSASLPPLRQLSAFVEGQLFSWLHNLMAIYCPHESTTLALDFTRHENRLISAEEKMSAANTSSVELPDSGYNSDAEEPDDCSSDICPLAALRADTFERKLAEQWLMDFISRSDELRSIESEETRQHAVDLASTVLESFYALPPNQAARARDSQENGNEEHSDLYSLDFSFEIGYSAATKQDPNSLPQSIKVCLNDNLAGKDSTDPDDVGLESWGAAVVLSELLCSHPDTFGLTPMDLPRSPRIFELGAGTGLVSIVLGKLLSHLKVDKPIVVATDYHPAVLDNLLSNVLANFPPGTDNTPTTAFLDWADPSCPDPELHCPADMLLASDVVYGPSHAVWLRDCATRLLRPGGVFWLLITVRTIGRFEGISDTVAAAFSAEDRPTGVNGRPLVIQQQQKVGKRSRLSRGGESGYTLFKIGWEES